MQGGHSVCQLTATTTAAFCRTCAGHDRRRVDRQTAAGLALIIGPVNRANCLGLAVNRCAFRYPPKQGPMRCKYGINVIRPSHYVTDWFRLERRISLHCLYGYRTGEYQHCQFRECFFLNSSKNRLFEQVPLLSQVPRHFKPTDNFSRAIRPSHTHVKTVYKNATN
jgi:hypothetical protein